MDSQIANYSSTIIGLTCLAVVMGLNTVNDNFTNNIFSKNIEGFGNLNETVNQGGNQVEHFYNNMPQQANTVLNNKKYGSVNPQMARGQQNVTLNTGDQLLSYQIYQQAVNAATPTIQQLDSISGQSQEQTGQMARQLGGGLSPDTAPYNYMEQLGNSEFQAVNMGNERAQSISACAQNAPSFVATSLLPKPAIPGQQSWDVNSPSNILASQNFLSATQQVGIDTVLGSLRNPSYDIRNTIVNPINVVSPWMNSTILPDLERRPLDNFVPAQGLYGGGVSGGCSTKGTYVGT